MSKEDLGPRPDKPPKSKRQLAQLPDVWIAEWLASDTIMPGERKKLQAIKDERKSRHPDVLVALILAREGMTPEQFKSFQRVLPAMGATEIHIDIPVPAKPYRVVRSLGVPIINHFLTPKDAIRSSTVVLAVPKETEVMPYATPGVWHLVGFARNRSMPVKVIMPDGREQ